MKRFTLIPLAFAAGCSWSTFDDLSDTAWAHAQEKPDSNESDYGVAIVGATSDTAGRIAVLGNGPPTYSTIEFNADGSTSSAHSDGLGNHSIDALSTRPILIGDGAGNVAVVDKGVDGAIVVIHGVATQLADTQVGTQQPPDGAIFAGTNILVAATAAPPPAAASANLFVVNASGVVPCILQDASNAPVAFAAIAADSTSLFAWTRTGVLLEFGLTAITGCVATVPIMPASSTFTSPTMPMTNGGQIDLIGDPAKFAVLTAFDSNATMDTVGQIAVVDLTAFTQVGASIPATGARTAVLGNVGAAGNATVFAVGFPARTVGSTTAAGAVEVHTVDTTTGAIDTTMVGQLTIPQAAASLFFGRGLAITKFNGESILVVGASNVVYAYYELNSLYGDTRPGS